MTATVGSEQLGPDSGAEVAESLSKENLSTPESVKLKKLPVTTSPTKIVQFALFAFVVIPFLALVSAIPVAIIIHWVTWLDLDMFVIAYVIRLHGITMGFHRGFTHRSHRPKRPLKIALAIAGSSGAEGPIIQWVSDHRAHHEFADSVGDPHSPWAYGTGFWNMVHGFWHAHTGWVLDRHQTDKKHYAKDLLDDKDIARIDKNFWVILVVTMFAPAVIEGLIDSSWLAAARGFFWVSLVGIAFLHHVTWSINSVCHMIGERTYETRLDTDQARNFWPLAIVSGGESWHNTHHADPSCAIHGVDTGQIDTTGRLIWTAEKLGLTEKVRWPQTGRYAPKQDVDDADRDSRRRSRLVLRSAV